MFGNRFFKFFNVLTRLGQSIGSCYISVDLKEQRLVLTKNPKVISRVNLNYNLTSFWCVSSFALVLKFYLCNDKERFNLTLFFWVGGFTFYTILSVFRWFTFDVCRVLNAHFVYFRYLQGKFFATDNITDNR